MKQTAESILPGRGKAQSLKFLFYLPGAAREDPGQKWPLILFLHGVGERGSNPRVLLRYGIPKQVEKTPDFPFIAISPQCPRDDWWPDLIPELNGLYDYALDSYPVDIDRIFLTGLSMGGYGTWSWASLYPDRFAAIAPICGGGPSFLGFPRRVCALKEVPVWAFHGAQDDTVPLSESEILVKTLAGCGGDVRFTVYPDAGHDSWTPTYANPQLYAWFLEHRRDGRRQEAGDPFEPE